MVEYEKHFPSHQKITQLLITASVLSYGDGNPAGILLLLWQSLHQPGFLFQESDLEFIFSLVAICVQPGHCGRASFAAALVVGADHPGGLVVTVLAQFILHRHGSDAPGSTPIDTDMV